MLHIWTSGKKNPALHQYIDPVLKKYGVTYEQSCLDDGTPKLMPGDTLFGLGGKVLDRLKLISALPKNRAITSLRSKRHEVNEKSVFVSYDPAVINFDATREPEVLWDAQLVARWVTTGDLMPDIGTYRYVDDLSDAVAYILREAVEGSPIPVTLDLETTGLDEFAHDAQIVSVALTYKEGRSDVLVTTGGLIDKSVHKDLEFICDTSLVKMNGANLKFDWRWLKKCWDIEITNQKTDTCLIGSLLDENRTNSLNMHAKQYTTMGGYDDPFNEKYDKGKMRENYEESPEDFLIYSGGDTDAAHRVVTPLKNNLVQDKALTNFYIRLLQPAAEAFAALEHRGVLVDMNRYDELEVEVQAELERLHGEAIDLLPAFMKMKHKENLSLGRPAIIQEFMFSKRGLDLEPEMFTAKSTPENPNPSTAMEHLEMFHDHPVAGPFVDIMREYNSAKKTLTTYITGFRKHLRPDGRFHPSYLLHRGDYEGKEAGTVTGRLSAKDPAYQTIPKHTIWAGPLRSVYVPPDGMAILKLDYDQGELKVTACIANEPTMIKTYQDGIDLHMKTGASVFGIDLEEALKMKAEGDPLVKEIRQGGKAGNFGLIYEMGPSGFQEYARKTYGVHLTMVQVETFIDTFFGTYTRLRPWHEDSKKFARNNGYVRSPLGRIRHLPLINSKDSEIRSKQERQSINSPVQGTLSDMTLLTIALLYERYPDLWVFGMTHDEIQMYVPIDEIETWAIRVAEVMENLPLREYFGWNPQLQFTAEADASLTNLAECVGLEEL
jgi:DNA polymerase I-like protein with 3'-5' exonuclease and polymerase domains